MNITTDSFYKDSRYTLDNAVKNAEMMHNIGVKIIDIGGESTRPGSSEVSTSLELDRVIPVIEYITNRVDIPISVDTSNAEVMLAAVKAGASMINDVRALSTPGALEAVSSVDVPVVLMHSLQKHPVKEFVPIYADVMDTVQSYLLSRVKICKDFGIESSRILLDPGFGGGLFGKTVQQNFQLLKKFTTLQKTGLPLLAGVSRKSFIGEIINKDVDQRLSGSLAVATILLLSGVNIIRVHDVAETIDVVQIVRAFQSVQ